MDTTFPWNISTTVIIISAEKAYETHSSHLDNIE